jgi:hypothetical protein
MRRPPVLGLLLVLSLGGACKRDAPAAPAASPPASAASPVQSAEPASSAPAPAPPHPVFAAAPDWGEPDMPKVRRLFEARFAEVKRCYEAELQKHPDARGKLTLRFTIAESGALRGVSVASTTFDRRRVPACVEQVVARWTTPFRPAAPVEVEYPFAFAPR